MKRLRAIFDDWLSRVAGVILVLIIALIFFNNFSPLPERYPLFGVFNFSLVPFLFVAGGVVFVLTILRIAGKMQRNIQIRREKLFFFMMGGAVGIMLLVVGGYQLVEFTDSVGFCGRLCHKVMYPEYTAYGASPHSRVLCYQCHVGSGASYLVKSKISGLPLIFSTLTGRYDHPIPTPVRNLRPARETCEQCHRPEYFSGDAVREHATFARDEANTRSVDTRVLRIGGGQQDAASGIHWHIANSLYYLPLDEKRQEIAWVGLEVGGNYVRQFVDPARASEVTPDRIQNDRRLMDCIDCHNRVSHIFNSPEDLVDAAIVLGRIDSGLPFIKREIVSRLDPPNATLEQADARLDQIKDFYAASYPSIAEEKADSISAAIRSAKDIAILTTFPNMKVDWNTYKSEAGHLVSPGCFRCHGKLVAGAGPGIGAPVEARCDLCHYTIPTPAAR